MDEKTKQKQEEIIELVSAFCRDNLNEEYEELSIKLVEKMGRKHDVPFKRGRLDIWASAVIYCIAQVNFLFDKKSEYHISADDICDYFGTKKSTVSNKAATISDMFNLAPLDKEFSATGNAVEAPEIFPDFAEMDEFFDEINSLYEDGKIEEALNKLDEIKEDDPDYPRSLFYKSLILASIGDERAEDLLKQSLMLEMKNTFNRDDMDFLMDEIFDEEYDESEELFMTGIADYNAGDFEDALSNFNALLKMDPNQSEVIYYKALTLAQLGRLKKALKFLDKAIKLDPDDDRFWNEKGNILTCLNRVNKAHKCFDKAIKLNPEDSVIWANKGFLYLEYENYEKALECYNKACELDPLEIHNIIGKSNVYLGMGDIKNTEKCLKKAEMIDDEDDEYLEAMAHFMFSQEKFDESIKYWDKRLEYDDEYAAAWIFKAFSYIALGMEKEADDCIEKACDIDPMSINMLEDFVSDD